MCQIDWTITSLIKVRKGQRVTSRGIDKNGLVNPLLTREKKEKDESEQLDTNNERVKYRQALVDIISKDEENTTSISHNQINTIRFVVLYSKNVVFKVEY